MYKCSSSDHSTLYQLRNIINRKNVVKDPKRNANACENFFLLVSTCHILTAAMEVLGMSSLEDSPSQFVPENAWLLTDKEKEDLLSCICKTILNNFCSIKYHVDAPSNDKSGIKYYSMQVKFSVWVCYTWSF